MLVADLAHQRPEIGRRHDYAAGTLHRLGNECGYGVRPLEADLAIEQLGANLSQPQVVVGVGVAVIPRRIDMLDVSRRWARRNARRGNRT